MPADAARAVGILGERAAVETRLAEYAVAGLDEVAVLPLAAGDPVGERTLRVPDRIRENAEYIEKNAEARLHREERRSPPTSRRTPKPALG